jgi:hypothetical protein
LIQYYNIGSTACIPFGAAMGCDRHILALATTSATLAALILVL